jgi:hypothetical protein
MTTSTISGSHEMNRPIIRGGDSGVSGMASDNVQIQRRRQLERRIAELKGVILDLTSSMATIQQQWLELANIHLFELDPITPAGIPFADYTETHDAKLYFFAKYAALILGTALAAYLSAVSLAADPYYLFFGTLIVAAVLSAVIVGAILTLMDVTARNANAKRRIQIWVGVFTTLLIGSLLWFGALRFSEDPALLQMVALALVIFEIAVFGLTGMFHCLEVINRWSSDLTVEFNVQKQRKETTEVELAARESALVALEKTT